MDKTQTFSASLKALCSGIPLSPIPEPCPRDNTVPHAPVRTPDLTIEEEKAAVENSLRYFPQEFHEVLAPEFAIELRTYGHIYMYRFRPNIEMRAHPLSDYPAKCRDAAAIMHMIMNNLDPNVAQFPHELITYGGNGQVFSNWTQFLLTMQYLSEMSNDQTLVMYSGHPMGLYPSSSQAPRLVITNGMVIPNYSSRENYDKMFAMGVTMYGQMTAGSYCYIGPQGIVHGTTLTILNAARKHLKTNDLSGKVFVSAGLGGMSGAQAKAAVISGCVGVIAEVSEEALMKRHNQGWVMEVAYDLDNLVALLRNARRRKKPASIGYHGNVVDVWERLVVEYESTGELLVDLGSDQTSCHNPYQGGYYPVQLNYQDAQDMIHQDPKRFKNLVQERWRGYHFEASYQAFGQSSSGFISLDLFSMGNPIRGFAPAGLALIVIETRRPSHHGKVLIAVSGDLCRQVKAINKLASRGMFFFDYGNAFLLEASRAGADVGRKDGRHGISFRYLSYVQDIMGDIFSMGFGPFRWVCTSGDPSDLEKTDKIAAKVIEDLAKQEVPSGVKQQFEDNKKWINEATQHKMVVGSQARILYSDQQGRVAIATEFNKAVADGVIKAPVVISRDHHDVSGTDSPFRETSNIYDGSSFCADMAVQNVIGDSFRGATWVALHNGGGCGWGEVINGGFGLVLDGSEDAGNRARQMLNWDVSNGVSRRCWAGNENAMEAIQRTMRANPGLRVTLPNRVSDDTLLERALNPTF